MIRPAGFQIAEANNVGQIADCTNADVGGCQVSNPLAANLMNSEYYGGTVGKYLVCCSRCGGLTVISQTFGGAKANDERLMESAVFFPKCNWCYTCDQCDGELICRCKLTHGVFYDVGVGMGLVGRCKRHGFRCLRSGEKRQSKDTLLSNVGSTFRSRIASCRIRVENKIGVSKNRCAVLSTRLPVQQMAHQHKVVYVAYVLLNFNPPMMV